ncbi:MAG: hypothetical protein KAG97_02070, partial [Victivallales bacterium]|nr:hypothetical protein [Victivallales bacterium]
ALKQQKTITTDICEKYERRLRAMTDTLISLGFPAKMPEGSFYLYVQAPKRSGSATFATGEDFSQWLIKEKRISSVPWDDAGAFIRFSATFVAHGGKEEEKSVLAEFANRLKDSEFEF